MQPEILRRGKEFHKRVQDDWAVTADGRVGDEVTINLIPTAARHKRKGRMDLFVDELGDLVTVVEIKNTDWDRVKHPRTLVGSHRRQVWRYIEKYLDGDNVDVCPGIIYPSPPSRPGLREEIEEHLNDYAIQVVWYDEA